MSCEKKQERTTDGGEGCRKKTKGWCDTFPDHTINVDPEGAHDSTVSSNDSAVGQTSPDSSAGSVSVKEIFSYFISPLSDVERDRNEAASEERADESWSREQTTETRTNSDERRRIRRRKARGFPSENSYPVCESSLESSGFHCQDQGLGLNACQGSVLKVLQDNGDTANHEQDQKKSTEVEECKLKSQKVLLAEAVEMIEEKIAKAETEQAVLNSELMTVLPEGRMNVCDRTEFFLLTKRNFELEQALEKLGKKLRRKKKKMHSRIVHLQTDQEEVSKASQSALKDSKRDLMKFSSEDADITAQLANIDSRISKLTVKQQQDPKDGNTNGHLKRLLGKKNKLQKRLEHITSGRERHLQQTDSTVFSNESAVGQTSLDSSAGFHCQDQGLGLNACQGSVLKVLQDNGDTANHEQDRNTSTEEEECKLKGQEVLLDDSVEIVEEEIAKAEAERAALNSELVTLLPEGKINVCDRTEFILLTKKYLKLEQTIEKLGKRLRNKKKKMHSDENLVEYYSEDADITAQLANIVGRISKLKVKQQKVSKDGKWNGQLKKLFEKKNKLQKRLGEITSEKENKLQKRLGEITSVRERHLQLTGEGDEHVHLFSLLSRVSKTMALWRQSNLGVKGKKKTQPNELLYLKKAPTIASQATGAEDESIVTSDEDLDEGSMTEDEDETIVVSDDETGPVTRIHRKEKERMVQQIDRYVSDCHILEEVNQSYFLVSVLARVLLLRQRAVNQAGSRTGIEDSRPTSSRRWEPNTSGNVGLNSSGDFEPKSSGDLRLKSSGDVQPKSSGDVQPKSSGDVQPKSSGDVQPKSSGDVLPKSSEDVLPTSSGDVNCGLTSASRQRGHQSASGLAWENSKYAACYRLTGHIVKTLKLHTRVIPASSITLDSDSKTERRGGEVV